MHDDAGGLPMVMFCEGRRRNDLWVLISRMADRVGGHVSCFRVSWFQPSGWLLRAWAGPWWLPVVQIEMKWRMARGRGRVAKQVGSREMQDGRAWEESYDVAFQKFWGCVLKSKRHGRLGGLVI